MRNRMPPPLRRFGFPVVLFACGFMIGLSIDAQAQGGLPPPTERTFPRVCEVPYTLAPGERQVLLCIANTDRVTLQGIAQVASGHEAVDAAIVHRGAVGRVWFSVTNRSTEVITATARGEQW